MMEEMTSEAEERQDWRDEEVEGEEGLGELLNVQTVETMTQIGHTEEEDVNPENPSVDSWNQGTVVSRWEIKEKEGETEVVLDEEDDDWKESATDVNIMSDQGKTQEQAWVRTWKRDPSSKSGSVGGLSTYNTDASRAGSASPTITTTNSSFGVEYADGSRGGGENVSTAVIPSNKLCPDGGDGRCSAATGDGHSTSHAAVSAASSYDNTTSGTASNSSHFERDLKPFSRTHSEANYLDFVYDRKLEQGGLELKKLDALLKSHQSKLVNKSLNTKGDKKPQQAGDSVRSKGANGEEAVQISGLKSDRSAHPAGLGDLSCVDGLLCGSEVEHGETLDLSQFTGAAKTNKMLSGIFKETHTLTSDSVGSEQMHQDSPGHSAVVAVAALRGAKSQLTGSEWAQVVPQWGLRSFGFVRSSRANRS